MSTYVWLSQGLLGSVNLTGRTDLALRVKDGQVAVDFLRPVDLQAATLATEAGASLFTLLPRGLPSVLLGAVTVGLQLPAPGVLPARGGQPAARHRDLGGDGVPGRGRSGSG